MYRKGDAKDQEEEEVDNPDLGIYEGLDDILGEDDALEFDYVSVSDEVKRKRRRCKICVFPR